MQLILSEKQLFDYIYCPAKYDMKYNKKIIIEDTFSINKILEKVSKFFYLYIMENKKIPSFNIISNKFESLSKNYIDIISSKKYTDSLFQLKNFYNWACSNQIVVIDSDVKYMLKHNNILIEGIMNPIAINKDKNLEFLITNFSSRYADQLESDTKLKYSIDMLAFNKTNKDNKIYATKIHNIKNNKDIITTRNDNDYKRLLKTIENVSCGINSGCYYPRESHMCQNCSYRYYCRGWK